MIEYEDLDLRIQADGDGYAVHAQRGSQVARESFDPVRWRSWDLGDLERQGPDEIKKRGSALFDSLIRGKVRDLYQQGRGGAGNNAAKGLRIRILIDLRDPRLRPFLNIPWELLYDRSADASPLLALDSRRAIVRMIDSNEPHVAPPAGDLKRVLLASANPIDTTPLKLDEERKRAEEALLRNHVRPDVLRSATRATLYDRIQDGAPQIVHFMGHGTVDTLYKEGALVLEGRGGKRDLLHASMFATFFTGNPMPRLVILNACLTAAAGNRERARTFSAFASVAAALSASGLPAVIAMQSTIRDDYAIRFTERLYEGLIQNLPVEAALSRARAAMSALDRYVLDWAAPVLYLRTHGGGTVQPSDAATPPAPTTSQPSSTSTTVHSSYGVVVIGTVGTLNHQAGNHGSH